LEEGEVDLAGEEDVVGAGMGFWYFQLLMGSLYSCPDLLHLDLLLVVGLAGVVFSSWRIKAGETLHIKFPLI